MLKIIKFIVFNKEYKLSFFLTYLKDNMKQWLKKLSQYQDPRQNNQSTENKEKKVIVSFQKHIEQNIQYVKQKNLTNIPNIIPNSQYQQDYHARSYSNLSKCVEIDQDDEKYQYTQGLRKIKDTKNNIINPFSNFRKKSIEKKQNSTNNKKQNHKTDPYSDQQYNSSQSDFVKDNQNQQNSQQIIDSFISMTNLIKVIKNVPDAKGEYITLKYLNKILIQSSTINKTKLNNFIISKSSQGIDAYQNRLSDKQKINTYNRIVNKIRKKNHQQEDQQIKKIQEINKFYFRTFSNGLTFQYYPVRSLIWKISSSYLPDSKEKWIWKMEISLLKYRELVKQNIIETSMKKKKGLQKLNAQKQKNVQVQKKTCEQHINIQKNQPLEIRKKSVTFSDPLSRLNAIKKNEKDHPLNIKQNSKWKTYFEDYQLWALIEKDTVRTRPGCSFFRETNTFSLTNDEVIQNDIVKVQLQSGQKVQFRLNELHLSKSKKQCTTYIDSISRILFNYLKVNPEQKYYQGMNELVAVIYYSLTNKNNEYFRRVSESDTYQIFTLLMTELNTYPSHVIDNSKLPSFNHFISGEKYFELLKIMIRKYDFRLDEFLQKNKGYEYLKAISIRWFLSIFLTQFNLDQALILWDPIMVLIGNRHSSDIHKNALKDIRLTQFILYMALAVVHLNRNEIYNEDLQQNKDCSKILIIFQKIKQKPQEIIQKTLALYKSFPNLLQ